MNREDPQQRIDPLIAELRWEPAGEPDWSRLHRTIRERAAPLLARRRFRRVTAIVRPLIPLAIAAGIAFVIWIGPEMMIDSPESDLFAELARDLDDETLLIEALVADLSEREFRLIVTGRANPEALLAVAVSAP